MWSRQQSQSCAGETKKPRGTSRGSYENPSSEPGLDAESARDLSQSFALPGPLFPSEKRV